MKKTIMTIAIVLGMALVSFGQDWDQEGGGGLFSKGPDGGSNNRDYNYPLLPTTLNGQHQDANDAPLGSGIAVLLGLGGAYLVGKKRKEA